MTIGPEGAITARKCGLPRKKTPMIDEAQTDSDHAGPPAEVGPRASLSTPKKLGFAAVILGTLLSGGEMLCRMLGLGRALEVNQYVSEWHDTPDGRTFWVVRGVGFNSDGMRDREHAIKKPAGTFRIVCLGDSVTVGHGVPMSQSYPYLLESFNAQMGLRVDVMNIAVSGWATLQEAVAYREIARKYKPDHVFLGFCLNDVAELHNNLTEPPPALMQGILRRSALARWLVNAKGREVHSVRELFDNPETPAVRDGWQRVAENLTRLRDDTLADGCGLSVLIFPFRFQVEPDPPEPIAQKRLFDLCQAGGIPCLDLRPALMPLGADAFVDQSHLSLAGAKVVAEEMIRWGRSGCMMCGHDLVDFAGEACPRCRHKIER